MTHTPSEELFDELESVRERMAKVLEIEQALGIRDEKNQTYKVQMPHSLLSMMTQKAQKAMITRSNMRISWE